MIELRVNSRETKRDKHEVFSITTSFAIDLDRIIGVVLEELID